MHPIITAIRTGLQRAADPQWVNQFVAEHADVLSPLSRREALKHIERKK